MAPTKVELSSFQMPRGLTLGNPAIGKARWLHWRSVNVTSHDNVKAIVELRDFEKWSKQVKENVGVKNVLIFHSGMIRDRMKFMGPNIDS